MKDELEQLKLEKNNAYWERNQLISALSKIFPSELGKHSMLDKEWEDDWRTIVYIEIPSEMSGTEGTQLSWHIHDDDVKDFKHLPFGHLTKWDGHSTEEKYFRLAELKKAAGLSFYLTEDE